MDDIKQYILSTIAAAVLTGIAISICGKKGISAAVVRSVAGIIMTVVILNPLLKFRFSDYSDYFRTIWNSAEIITESGVAYTDSELTMFITERTEAYILDKAHQLGSDIHASVELMTESPYLPISVYIEGRIAPYAKSQLTQIIEKDLGVEKGNQIWIQRE